MSANTRGMTGLDMLNHRFSIGMDRKNEAQDIYRKKTDACQYGFALIFFS